MDLVDINRIRWIYNNLRIINKEGSLVRLCPNEGQILLHNSFQEQRVRGFPVRVILLKPRRVGWSTWCEAEGFYEVYHRKNWNALAVAHDSDATSNIFRMTQIFHAEMPNPLAADNTNRREIIFSRPHRSSFLSQTAGKIGLGRSFLSHYLHCSEVAFWEQAKRQFAGLAQIVPDKANTVVVLESTANGVGGAFYDMFWEANERFKDTGDYRGYIAVFFPWYRFSEYSITPGKDFRISSQEESLSAEFGLTPGQIYWRRLKLEELSGDEGLFKQEYPATATEAFQASGNPVFTQSMIGFQNKRLFKDPRYCILRGSGGGGDVLDVDRRFDCWVIGRGPIEGHSYALGIDTMEGRLSDVQDPKSRLDCDGMAMMDRNDGEIVAIYHGRTEQSQLGEQALWGARWYNEAWIAPEIPAGMVLLKVLKDAGYSNIFNRQVHDDRIDVVDSEMLGWRTTLLTRSWLVNDLLKVLREQSLLLGFSEIINEMRTFIRDKTGKPIHMQGKHDDLLFAVMIALQVQLRCPSGVGIYPGAKTADSYEPVPAGRELSYSGAVDPGILELGDGYYDYHTN